MLRNDDLAAWSARLGLNCAAPPSVKKLHWIVQVHQYHFPFENIDVYCGRLPSLEVQALAQKLIRNRRGGYCFELNALLGAGLGALGFDLRPCMARVLWERDEPGPRTHTFLLVEAGERPWLVDVGFGGPGPMAPIEMATNGLETTIGATAYRLEQHTDLGTVLARRSRSGAWTPLYAFTPDRICPDDLASGNKLAAKSTGSIFRQGLKIARQSPETRLSLNGWDFKRYAGADLVEAKALDHPADVVSCLTRDFGIMLDQSTVDELTDRL